MWQLSQYYHLSMVIIPSEANGEIASPALWVLMSRSPAVFQQPAIAKSVFPLEGYTTKIPLWTDNFSNIFQILR
jgi:hypothetical protein